MPQENRRVDGAAIKAAIEGRDGDTLSSFYTDDAVMRIVDKNNPPSKPLEIRGRQAIATYWQDVCNRAMTHRIDTTVAEGDRLAFTETCTYPDGARVFCAATLDLAGGRIAHQTTVQAWDE
jgi:ketosteroid isomerase-like protein